MTPETETRDIIVIGGGVIGCAIAEAVAPDRDVLVVEKGPIAGEASGLAAGNINPALSYPDWPAIAHFVQESFKQLDGPDEFHRRHRLELVMESAGANARRRTRDLRDRGLPVSFHEADSIESEHPTFNLDGYAGAVQYTDGGWIDPHRYTIALRNRAANSGVEFRTGIRVKSIRSAGNGLVRTTDGDVVAGHVVAAAGWRTAELLEPVMGLPVRPFLTQCVTLEPQSPLSEGFPMGRDPDANLYFRPEPDGTLLVGGGRTTAIDDPDGASAGIEAQPGFRRTVAEAAPGFLRGFDAATVSSGWAGVDGATPDGRPVVDVPATGPEGLIVATGFHGGGIRDSPVAAAIVRALVLDTTLPFDPSPFALSRFESRQRDFPVSKTYDEHTSD